MPSKPYDVALSFFARDVGFARELYERLGRDLNVFFFERAQDELTGREGDEVFRTPFRDALVSVVLLRPGYGEKMWTGVEKTAIAETCLKRGYKNLFVVLMEKMPIPDWIPATHIYFDVETFAVEDLVGAIKAKVVELGGRPVPLTAERRAELHMANQKFEAARRDFRTYNTHYPKMVAEVAALSQFVAAKCNSLAATGVEIEVAYNEGRCVIRNSMVSVIVFWRMSGYGQIEHEALTVEEYSARMEMPHDRVFWPEGRPKPIQTDEYELELTRSLTLAWKPKRRSELVPSPVLADRIVIRFMDLTDKITHDRNRQPR